MISFYKSVHTHVSFFRIVYSVHIKNTLKITHLYILISKPQDECCQYEYSKLSECCQYEIISKPQDELFVSMKYSI